MNRFGVVPYRANSQEEFYTTHIVGYVPREGKDIDYPSVLFTRTKEEAIRAALDLATLYANVKFSVFELSGGYESLPQRPAQFSISERGVLPV